MVNRLAARSTPSKYNGIISEFIDYMHDYSDQSVKNYTLLVKRFLKKTRIKPKELNKRNIMEYCRKYESGFVYLRYLKLFGKFLYDKEEIDEKIYLGIKLLNMKKRETKHIPVIVPKKHWKELYNKLNGPLKMGLYLHLNFGLRIGEVCNLTIQDVDLESNLLRIRPKNGWKPKSKSSIRELPITTNQKAILSQYLQLRIKKDLNHNYFLYYKSNGEKLQEENVSRYYKKHIGIISHDLRKSAGTYLFNNSLERETIKDFLGHKDIRTTDLYLSITNEDKINRIKEAQKKANL